MTILQAGIIGLGIGEAHLAGYRQHPDCEVVAICDRNEDKLQEIASRNPGLRLYSSAEDLLDDPKIDVVSIASYDEDHFSQVCRAIASGKHVFVEKPICQSVAELRVIRQLLSENPSVRLSTNLILRASPRFIDLHSLITQGALGQIYYLEADYNYGRLSKLVDGWRGKQDFYSVVYGGGVHIVDLLMWLTNDRIIEVAAFGNSISSAGSGFRNKDMVVATLKFSSGIVGKISVNFGSVTPHFHKVSVYGTDATFENRPDSGLIYRSRNADCDPEKLTSAYPGTGKHELIPSFLSAILRRNTPVVDERAAFDCMSVCFGIEKAVSQSRIVKIDYSD